MARRIVICLAVITLGGVLGASVYNSVVDAPRWGANIPESLNTAQRYFTVTNPATLFRVASPLAQAWLSCQVRLTDTPPSTRWAVPGTKLAASDAR